VAELERAKIIERVTRGKQLRLSQGQLLGCGVHTFGYDYQRKTPTSPPRMVINEREAEIVRSVFETYAGTQIGLDTIAQRLEDAGTLTKTGKKLWRRSFLKTMLCNETYLGVKYFNTMRCVREYANPIYGIKHSTKKMVPRGREDWIGVEVPAIISHELFDRVRKRREANRSHYRNPRQAQLLSGLVRCGSCGRGVYVTRRWERSQRDPLCIMHKAAYKCNWSFLGRLHSKNSEIDRCHNPQIKSELLEARVFAMVRDVMLDPQELRGCMDFFKEDTGRTELRIEKELKSIDESLASLHEKKRRIIDVYASGDLSRNAYVEKNREYDGLIETLRDRSKGLAESPALRRNTGAIEAAIAQYCGAARMQFAQRTDFNGQRQFLLDHIEKVVYLKNKVSVHGRVPIKGEHEVETTMLTFCIESEITKEERYREKLRTMEAMRHQQSMVPASRGRATLALGHVL
jgi:hypothetical protein